MVDPADFAERAAILEADGGFCRAEAERLALGEILDQRLAETPAGILGELLAADRMRRHPAAQEALAEARVVGRRAPAWGLGHIVSAGGPTYRPAEPGEPRAAAAIIVAATDDGAVVDLIAQVLGTGALYSRLDVAAVIGADEVEAARAAGRALLVFPTLSTWLRADCRGVAIVDWRRAGRALDGVAAILAPRRLVEPLARATQDCRPRPIIATPHKRGARVAA
jgi:hypothetical protein